MIEGAHEQLVAPLSITLQSSPGMLPFSQALEHIKISLMSLGWHKGTDLNRCRIAQQSNSRDKMVKTQRTSLTLSWKRKKKMWCFSQRIYKPISNTIVLHFNFRRKKVSEVEYRVSISRKRTVLWWRKTSWVCTWNSIDIHELFLYLEREIT